MSYINLDGNGQYPDARLTIDADRDEDAFLTLEIEDQEDGNEIVTYLILAEEVPAFLEAVEKAKASFDRLNG